jgi:hypothetical protein
MKKKSKKTIKDWALTSASSAALKTVKKGRKTVLEMHTGFLDTYTYLRGLLFILEVVAENNGTMTHKEALKEADRRFNQWQEDMLKILEDLPK